MQAFAAVAALALPPFGSAFDQLADPVQRLDIVDERGPAEDSDLEWQWRAMARQAALALDTLDHGGFLAADIGARPPAKVNVNARQQSGLRQFRDLARQNFAARRILV